VTVGVYAFFDSLGDCLYVGQSSDLEQRNKQHLKHLRGGYHKREEFNEWFRINGESKLVFKILEECIDEGNTKNSLEIKYFISLNPRFYGQIPSMANKFIHTDETRSKISRTVRKNLEDIGVYYTKVCHCGVSFTVSASSTSKNCSMVCYHKSQEAGLDCEMVSELYNSGLTLKQVGDRLGVSYRTVHSFMVRNGIPRRASGTRLKI
jgi:GIY-YIG catalytic domain